MSLEVDGFVADESNGDLTISGGSWYKGKTGTLDLTAFGDRLAGVERRALLLTRCDIFFPQGLTEEEKNMNIVRLALHRHRGRRVDTIEGLVANTGLEKAQVVGALKSLGSKILHCSVDKDAKLVADKVPQRVAKKVTLWRSLSFAQRGMYYVGASPWRLGLGE